MSLQIALQRIEDCRQTHSVVLDLSELEFTELPSQVFELTWLEQLDISADWHRASKIESIPGKINRLVNLRRINCSFNQIVDLTPLARLPNLTQLECSSNRISDLSPLLQLKQLKRLDAAHNPVQNVAVFSAFKALQELDCSGMQMTALGAVSGLHELQQLNCSHNQIDDLTALSGLLHLKQLQMRNNRIVDLSPLGKLHQLEHLNVSQNLIESLPDVARLDKLAVLNCSHNPLHDLAAIGDLKSLKRLNVAHTRVRSLSTIYHMIMHERLTELYLFGSTINDIPAELLGADAFDNCINQLRYYYADLEKGRAHQQQIKLQFVGNGRVGKSTLAYALEHQMPPDENFKETHGIVIKDVKFSIVDLPTPVTLQFWDFGGQEIYHTTHRMFFSAGSLYLLLWAEDTEEDEHEVRHSIGYWLEAIHDLAQDCPIVLIKNQIDRADQLPVITSEVTSDTPGFEQIKHLVKISALKYQGIAKLRDALADVLEKMKHRLTVSLPVSWLKVKRALEQGRTEKSIPFAEFQRLCDEAGVTDADVLIDYLHKAGYVFYRKKAFLDHIILDQNWAIDAVYRLFDPYGKRELLQRMGGRFSGEDAAQFWPEAGKAERMVYIEFMTHCGICYGPMQDQPLTFDQRQFIVPALLPEKPAARPAMGNPGVAEWLLEVEYPFLHRTIIERLIIETGRKYAGKPWRHGIYCEIADGTLFLECKRQGSEGQLQFQLIGNQLSGILHEVRVIIARISPNKRYREFLTTEDSLRELLSAANCFN